MKTILGNFKHWLIFWINMIPKSQQESFILYSYNNNVFSNLVPSLQSEVVRKMQNKNHLYDFTLISYDENASQNFFKV